MVNLENIGSNAIFRLCLTAIICYKEEATLKCTLMPQLKNFYEVNGSFYVFKTPWYYLIVAITVDVILYKRPILPVHNRAQCDFIVNHITIAVTDNKLPLTHYRAPDFPIICQ